MTVATSNPTRNAGRRDPWNGYPTTHGSATTIAAIVVTYPQEEGR